MQKTIFEIRKMDCPSEENLIRMKLEGFSKIKKLTFNIPSRELCIYHNEEVDNLSSVLNDLNLGSQLISSEQSESILSDEIKNQKKFLWFVLLINFSFFLLEMITGLLSKSMGLVADSLDMLADSFVYGLSLMAVGRSLLRKKRVALLAGYFQIILAFFGFAEVIRRFLFEVSLPNFKYMIGISVLALLANGISLIILQKSKGQEEAHIKASMIFTSNDIIINLGVILAGILVYSIQSNIPDLIIGAVVFIIVINGARRILQLGK